MKNTVRSPLTTLCYIERDNKYLMLHRIKKQTDVNKDKWIGVGGHFEQDESPEQCLLREVKEETGLTLLAWKFRGFITFVCEGWNTEYMCLYVADEFTGELTECEEGELVWVEKDKLEELNLWEGDKVFLKLLQERQDFFTMKLVYQGDILKECLVDNKPYKKTL